MRFWGLAVTSTQTARAEARPLIGREFVTQNHSGKPTSPAERRGGAVRTTGTGIGIRVHVVNASSAGEIFGAFPPPSTGLQTCTLSPEV
ncbi:hypothetical protein ACIBI3_44600 [Actinomadura luteofluorescens]|uniref:hypothetical protein n=1 Tax=Actinomadura luteofluorescens TaxID=46163 RepID=UPI003496AC55